MKRGAGISAAVLFVLLATLGLALQKPDRAVSRSSFGTAPFGFKAVFDLLVEAGVPVQRNLDGYGELPERSTVWWIVPSGICRGESAAEPSQEGEADDEAWSGRGWLERGGTAVVFLAEGQGAPECARVVGVAVPERAEHGEARAAGADQAQVDSARVVEGPLLPRPRVLPESGVLGFAAAADGAQTVARTGGDVGTPFIVETKVGDGRVVLVGDAAFLSNAQLDQADAAPLVMDLVRAYGPPIIDERDHGFGSASTGTSYLLRSPALAMLGGLALLGVAFAWWGAALPPLTANTGEPPAPTLDNYVASLATLYSRAPDHAAAAAQYHELILNQIRRRMGLALDTPTAVVIDRLTRESRIDEEEGRRLRQAPAVASAAELRQLAQALDEILRKGTR